MFPQSGVRDRAFSRTVAWAVAIALSMVMPCHAATQDALTETAKPSVNEYPYDTVFRESIFTTDAARGQRRQDLYRASNFYPFAVRFFPEDLDLASETTKTLEQMGPLVLDDLDARSSVSTALISFTGLILLAKNGYEQAMEKEFAHFTKQLLRFHNLISGMASLNENQKIELNQILFSEMAQIKNRIEKKLGPGERARIRDCMKIMGQHIINGTFKSELKEMQNAHIANSGPMVSTIFVFSMFSFFAGMILGIGHMDDFLALRGFTGANAAGLSLFIGGSIASAAVPAGLTYSFVNYLFTKSLPYNNKVQRMKDAAKSCLSLLTEKDEAS